MRLFVARPVLRPELQRVVGRGGGIGNRNECRRGGRAAVEDVVRVLDAELGGVVSGRQVDPGDAAVRGLRIRRGLRRRAVVGQREVRSVMRCLLVSSAVHGPECDTVVRRATGRGRDVHRRTVDRRRAVERDVRVRDAVTRIGIGDAHRDACGSHVGGQSVRGARRRLGVELNVASRTTAVHVSRPTGRARMAGVAALRAAVVGAIVVRLHAGVIVGVTGALLACLVPRADAASRIRTGVTRRAHVRVLRQ